MGEWFREFQVACAKSEEVMQKKSTSKSLGDLSSSLYAFSAPSGNLLDDDNFDTIRFCDALPVHGPADQPQGQANIQAPSAGTSETVSLAALLGQKMVR